MKKLSSGLIPPIITGIMVGTSYIPFPPWALFFCFIPLMWYWSHQNDLKKIFISGWIAQFILTLIGFNWVIYTIHEFGRMPWSLSLIGLLAFCSFANLNIPLAGVIWHLLFKKTKNLAVRVTSLVVILAISERLFPMIFDWHIGYTWLWAKFPAYHLADIIGFFGLSTITILFQGLFLYTWLKYEKLWGLKHSKISGLIYSVSLFAALNILGLIHQPNISNDKSLKVSVIQANIGNLEKQMAEVGLGFRQSIIDRYLALTKKEESNQPDFFLWPETAFPDFLTPQSFFSGFYGAQVRSYLAQNDKTLITGTYGLTPNGQMTNSIVALNKDGFITEAYHKTHLLAFGEFIPGANFFPILKKWLPMVADFQRGPGPSVIEIKNSILGVQICYEGLFDHFTRSLSNKGAQIIINVTNDSWYGTWQEPYQHMTMTLARAIEVRRPLVRATNTGISTVQLADGKTLEKSPLAKSWSHTYEVPYRSNPQRTLFAGFGYWVFPIFLVALFIWTLLMRRKP